MRSKRKLLINKEWFLFMNPFERIFLLGFQQIIPIGWMKCPAEKISYWIGHPVQLDKTSPLNKIK
jgi:hypothetical protein